MNIQEAKDEIIHTVRIYTRKNDKGQYLIPTVHQRPILLIGPPGIGKTAIMRQAAEACGVGLVAYTITHHTRQSAVGLPVVKTRTYAGREVSVTEYTMSEIVASVYECIEQTGNPEGILFIDEINCVSETLTPTMLQFLQNKTFGTHRVPEGWIIVAAGNPPEYNKSARMFDVVTLDRVKSINIEVDFPVWKSYASQTGMHSAIISYLSSKTQNFYYIEESRGDRDFVTARGWDDLSVLLKAYEEEEIPVTLPVIREYIHSDRIASDFAAYYRMFTGYKKEYTPQKVLQGTIEREAEVHQEQLLAQALPDEQYSILQMFLSELHRLFRVYEEAGNLQKRRKEVFIQIKSLADRQKELSAETMLIRFLEQFDTALKIKDEHQIISEAERKREEAVSRFYSDCMYELKGRRVQDIGIALKDLEEKLQAADEKQEKEAQNLTAMVDRALLFLEESVGEGEMMGYFMTSLSQNPSAARFLGANACDRFLKHLDLMAAVDEEEELKRQIEEYRKQSE
ncbi:MAG: AAA family ATPase [Lachnospiraceae bacterium]|nr:AAA family ATPase [Lachnospiraceae bacterium]